MATRLRIATFNLENLADKPGLNPSSTSGSPSCGGSSSGTTPTSCVSRRRGQPDAAGDLHLSALDKLLATTQCATHQRVVGAKADGTPNRERNVLTLSRFNIQKIDDATGFRPPWYQMSQAVPPATAPVDVIWERPILHDRSSYRGTGSCT